MRTPTRLLLAAALTFALAAAGAPSAGATEWRSWDEGIQKARAQKRPMVVDVYTDWCGWCKRMDADVYARKDVSEYLAARFVSVKLNAESSQTVHWDDRPMTSRSLAGNFKVTGYPTTVFLNAQGERLANVPGYIPADRFLLLLRYIGDGDMDRGVKWDDFVARQPKAK
ncbi:MAG: thioredoxin fold domain-containing protein [Candidatus Eisenbacteria bacterium]|nr:thioredoxin fold domain-containing protein [Candidatus Eisenbacteria bacterium]